MTEDGLWAQAAGEPEETAEERLKTAEERQKTAEERPKTAEEKPKTAEAKPGTAEERPGLIQAGDDSELSFEAGIENLERIVEALEQREVPLETALALFKDGVGLVRHCSRLLDQAEQEMRILVEEDGKLQIRTVNFPPEG